MWRERWFRWGGGGGFSIGDQVFRYGGRHLRRTLCRQCGGLGEDPQGARFDPGGGAPLATTTGNSSFPLRKSSRPTVLVVGAVGSVWASAVFTAKNGGDCDPRGFEASDGRAKTIGADRVVATDDDTAMRILRPLDAVRHGRRKNAEKLIAKVKPGGVFATVVGAPQNAAHYPAVKVGSSILEIS